MQDFVAAEAVVAAVDCVVAEAEETEVNVNEYYISFDLA